MIKVCTLLVIILVFTSGHSNGQSKKTTAGGIEMQVSAADTSLNFAFCTVGQMPEFPGGTTKLVAFAKRNIKYPETAVNDSVQGSVILHFSINTKGKVTDKKVVRSVRRDLDSVCLRMLSRMPNWKAGRLNGKSIKCFEQWKITFVLTD